MLRSLFGVKFIDGEPYVKLLRLERFLPDKPYWGQQESGMASYPEGISTFNCPPYGGPAQSPSGWVSDREVGNIRDDELNLLQ